MITELRIQTTDQAVSDGTVTQARGGKTGAQMIQESHARYQDAVRRGNVYTVANQAVLALSVNSTTATGLILTNPAGSGKNLVLLELCVALASSPAGIAVLAIVGTAGPGAAANVTHTTPITTGFRNALFGGANGSVALVDSAATVPAVQYLRAVPGGPIASTPLTAPFIKDEIAGALTIAPGGCISLQSTTTAISVMASLTWEEVPVT